MTNGTEIAPAKVALFRRFRLFLVDPGDNFPLVRHTAAAPPPPSEKPTMSSGADGEPFPLLSAAMTADRQLASEMSAAARRRRKSSGLGSDLRVGDTGAPALATSLAHLNGSAKVW